MKGCVTLDYHTNESEPHLLSRDDILSTVQSIDSLDIETIESDHIHVWDNQDAKSISFRFLEEMTSKSLAERVHISRDIPVRYQISTQALSDYLWATCDKNAFITLEDIVVIWSEPDDHETFEPSEFVDYELTRLVQKYGDDYAYELGTNLLGQMWFERNSVVINMGEIVRTALAVAQENSDLPDPYFSFEQQVLVCFLTTVLHELRHLQLDTNILLSEDDYPLSLSSEDAVEAYCRDVFEDSNVLPDIFPFLFTDHILQITGGSIMSFSLDDIQVTQSLKLHDLNAHIHGDMAGYITGFLSVDDHDLEILYRISDDKNGADMELVSVDYGYLHPSVEKNWDSISSSLKALSTAWLQNLPKELLADESVSNRFHRLLGTFSVPEQVPDRFLRINGQDFSFSDVANALGIELANQDLHVMLCQRVDAGILAAQTAWLDHDDYPGIDVDLILPEEQESNPVMITRTEQPRPDGEHSELKTFCYSRDDEYFMYFTSDTRSDEEVDEEMIEPHVTLSGSPSWTVFADAENPYVRYSGYVPDRKLSQKNLQSMIDGAESRHNQKVNHNVLNHRAGELSGP